MKFIPRLSLFFPSAIFPSTRPLYKRTGVRRCCPLSWYRKYSFPRRKSYGIGYIINPVFLILRQLQNPICIRRPFVFAASLKFQTHTLICFTAVVLSVLSVSFNIFMFIFYTLLFSKIPFLIHFTVSESVSSTGRGLKLSALLAFSSENRPLEHNTLTA